MNDKVVFTMSLDDEADAEPADSADVPAWRRTAVMVWTMALRLRLWRLGVVATALLPLAGGAVVTAAPAGSWASTVVIGLASVLAMASAAIVAARVTLLRAAQHQSRERAQSDAGPWRQELLGETAGLTLAGLALTVATTPALIWLAVTEGLGEAQLAPLVGVLAFEVSVASLVGQSIATWLPRRRPTLSAALAMTALMLGPLALFGAALPLVESEDQVLRLEFATGLVDNSGQAHPGWVCRHQTTIEVRARTERIWPLLAASPIVAVIDAPERTASSLAQAADGTLEATQYALRNARLGPLSTVGGCNQSPVISTPEAVAERRLESVSPLTHIALAMHGALAVVVLGGTISRRRRSSR